MTQGGYQVIIILPSYLLITFGNSKAKPNIEQARNERDA